MNIEVRKKGEETSWDDLTNLLHEAFQERLDQGLHFSCSYLTPEDFERVSAKAVVLVAIDKDKNRLIGTSSVVIHESAEGKWAYFQNTAVHPDYKHQGVGSKLEEYRTEVARENGCQYVLGDTATRAKSSINFRKKYGFRIVGLKSWPATNYYSYVFRKQLVPDSKWSNPLYCKFQFWKSAIRCRMYHLANGQDRKSKWLDLYKKLRGIPS